MTDLSLVIEQGPVKRRLEGDFRICASRASLERIVRVLNGVLEGDFYYGWVDVRERLPTHPNNINSEPLPWSER